MTRQRTPRGMRRMSSPTRTTTIAHPRTRMDLKMLRLVGVKRKIASIYNPGVTFGTQFSVYFFSKIAFQALNQHIRVGNNKVLVKFATKKRDDFSRSFLFKGSEFGDRRACRDMLQQGQSHRRGCFNMYCCRREAVPTVIRRRRRAAVQIRPGTKAVQSLLLKVVNSLLTKSVHSLLKKFPYTPCTQKQ